MTMRINDNGVDRDMTAKEETAHKIFQAEATIKATADALAVTQAAIDRSEAIRKLKLAGLTNGEIREIRRA